MDKEIIGLGAYGYTPTVLSSEELPIDQMAQTSRRADPLMWEHGPRVFEIYLGPTCPFSVQALGKLDALLAEAGPDRITIDTASEVASWTGTGRWRS